MGKVIKLLFACMLFTISFSGKAAEGYLCQLNFDKAQRHVNIMDKKQDLSELARKKLLDDLLYETKECISDCEGSKFEFCNNVAKRLE